MTIDFQILSKNFRFNLNCQKSTLAFIINLAICDFFYCSLPLPIQSAQFISKQKLLENWACVGISAFRNVILYADYLSIGMIAFSRFMNIINVRLVEKHSRFLVICIWMVAIILFIPQIIRVSIFNQKIDNITMMDRKSNAFLFSEIWCH